jgi:FkbM family methyltransferase
MNIVNLFKHEYILNPPQVLRRIAIGVSPPRRDRVTARTPWGWDLEVHTNDDVGKTILCLGVYDLVTSETVWRLTDAGETVLDIGANIGYMTSLLAKRVGRSGRVLSFEPHPEIAGELRANIGRWRGAVGEGVIMVHEVALSDREGTVRFDVPARFATNRGIARVASAGDADEPGGLSLEVACDTLDHAVVGVGPVGVAKIDVEGHEEAVVRGAAEAFEGRQIRDWVFEHHPAYPSPVTDTFERHRYAVFQIQKRILGPSLVPASTPVARSVWEPPNYLATLDPERALDRMRARGWKVLRSGHQVPDATPGVF